MTSTKLQENNHLQFRDTRNDGNKMMASTRRDSPFVKRMVGASAVVGHSRALVHHVDVLWSDEGLVGVGRVHGPPIVLRYSARRN